MIRSLSVVGIPVADQARALAFYPQKLGFEVFTDQPMGEQRWIELRIPGFPTSFSLFTPEEHRSRVGTFTGLSLNCDDVDRTYAEMAAHGVELLGPPKREPWGTYFLFKDSEGNTLLVAEK